MAGIAVSRDGAAGTAALFGDIATLPCLAAPSGSLGAMMLICLTQQPLFVGLWLGVRASMIAGVAWMGGAPRYAKRWRSTAALAGVLRASLNCSTRTPSFCLASSSAYRWQ